MKVNEDVGGNGRRRGGRRRINYNENKCKAKTQNTKVGRHEKEETRKGEEGKIQEGIYKERREGMRQRAT